MKGKTPIPALSQAIAETELAMNHLQWVSPAWFMLVTFVRF